MAKTNNKRSEAAAAKAKQVTQARHVAYVCAGIEPHRGSNGHIPRGVMQKVFEEHNAVNPWLKIDLVKKGLKKTKSDMVVVNISAISELSNPTFESSKIKRATSRLHLHL